MPVDPRELLRGRSRIFRGVGIVGRGGTIGERQYSGVGGHELFVIGAHDSEGGRSIICLHSTAAVNGETLSSIVPALPAGTPVTTPRHHVQYVVTEHGVANLGMLTARERREALMAIAHPDFRAALRTEPRK
jgi:acyl-CoA hydrolase